MATEYIASQISHSAVQDFVLSDIPVDFVNQYQNTLGIKKLVYNASKFSLSDEDIEYTIEDGIITILNPESTDYYVYKNVSELLATKDNELLATKSNEILQTLNEAGKGISLVEEDIAADYIIACKLIPSTLTVIDNISIPTEQPGTLNSDNTCELWVDQGETQFIAATNKIVYNQKETEYAALTQEAIDTAYNNGGGTLVITDKNSNLETPLYLKNGVKITGNVSGGSKTFPNYGTVYGNDLDNSVILRNLSFSDVVFKLQSCNILFENCSFTGIFNSSFCNLEFKNCTFQNVDFSDISGISNYEFTDCNFIGSLGSINIPTVIFTHCSIPDSINTRIQCNELYMDSTSIETLESIKGNIITISNSVINKNKTQIQLQSLIEAETLVKIDNSYFNGAKISGLKEYDSAYKTVITAPTVNIRDSAFTTSLVWNSIVSNTNQQVFSATQSTFLLPVIDTNTLDNSYTFFNSCVIIDNDKTSFKILRPNAVKSNYSNLINSYIFTSNTSDVTYQLIGSKSTETYGDYGSHVVASSSNGEYVYFSKDKNAFDYYLNGSIEYFKYIPKYIDEKGESHILNGKSVTEINTLFKGNTWNIPYALPTIDIFGNARSDVSVVGPAILGTEPFIITPYIGDKEIKKAETKYFYFCKQTNSNLGQIRFHSSFASSSVLITFYKDNTVINPIEITDSNIYVFNGNDIFDSEDRIVRIYAKFTLNGGEYISNPLDFVNISEGLYIGSEVLGCGISEDSGITTKNWESILTNADNGIIHNLFADKEHCDIKLILSFGKKDFADSSFFDYFECSSLIISGKNGFFDDLEYAQDNTSILQYNGTGSINLGDSGLSQKTITLSKVLFLNNSTDNQPIVLGSDNVQFIVDSCSLWDFNFVYSNNLTSYTNSKQAIKFTNSIFRKEGDGNSINFNNSNYKLNQPIQNANSEYIFKFKNCKFENTHIYDTGALCRYEDCNFVNSILSILSNNTFDLETTRNTLTQRNIVRCSFVNCTISNTANIIAINSTFSHVTFSGRDSLPISVFCSFFNVINAGTLTTDSACYGDFNAYSEISNFTFKRLHSGKETNIECNTLIGTSQYLVGNAYLGSNTRLEIDDLLIAALDHYTDEDFQIGIDGVVRNYQIGEMIDCGALPMKIYYVSARQGKQGNSGIDWEHSIPTIREAVELANTTFGCIFVEEGNYNNEYNPVLYQGNIDESSVKNAELFITSDGEEYAILKHGDEYGIDTAVLYNNWWNSNPSGTTFVEITVNTGSSEYYYKAGDLIGNIYTNRTNSIILGNFVNLFGGFKGTEPNRIKPENLTGISKIYGSNSTSIYQNDNVSLNKQNSQFCLLYDTVSDGKNETKIGYNYSNPYNLITSRGNSIIENIGFIGGCANTYPYVKAAVEGITNETLIKGLYIASENNFGSAILSLEGSLSIKNCSFENNESFYHGSAIAAVGGKLDISNCTFKNNKSTNHGGTIFAGGNNMQLDIDNCVFDSNVAKENGAGVYITSLNADTFGSLESFIASLLQEKYTANTKALIKNSVFSNNCASHGIIYTRHNGFTGYSNIFGKNFLTSDNGTVIELTESNTKYVSPNSVISNSLFYYNRNNTSTNPISIRTSGVAGANYTNKAVFNNNLLYSSAGIYNKDITYSTLEFNASDAGINAVCNERKLLNNKFDNILNTYLIDNFVPYINDAGKKLITEEIPSTLRALKDDNSESTVSVPVKKQFSVYTFEDWMMTLNLLKAYETGLHEREFEIYIGNDVDFAGKTITRFDIGQKGEYDLSKNLGDIYFIGNGHKMTTSIRPKDNDPAYGENKYQYKLDIDEHGIDRHFIGLFPKTTTPRRIVFDDFHFEYGYSWSTFDVETHKKVIPGKEGNAIKPADVYGEEFGNNDSGSYGTSGLFGYVDLFYNKCSFKYCSNATYTNDGGTLFLYQGHNYLNQCTFENNYVDSNGTCVYNKGSVKGNYSTVKAADNRSTISLYNCYARNNKCTQNASCVYNNSANETACTYCKFEDNINMHTGAGGVFVLKVTENNVLYNNIFIDNTHPDSYTDLSGKTIENYKGNYIYGPTGSRGEIIKLSYNGKTADGTEGDVDSLYFFNNTIYQDKKNFQSWFYFDAGTEQTVDGNKFYYTIKDKRVHNNLLLSSKETLRDIKGTFESQVSESDGNKTQKTGLESVNIKDNTIVNSLTDQTFWSLTPNQVNAVGNFRTKLHIEQDSALYSKLINSLQLAGSSINLSLLPEEIKLVFNKFEGSYKNLAISPIDIINLWIDTAAIIAALPDIKDVEYILKSDIIISQDYYDSVLKIIAAIIAAQTTGQFRTITYNADAISDEVEYQWSIGNTVYPDSTRILRYTPVIDDNELVLKCSLTDGINTIELNDITLLIAEPITANYNKETIEEFETKETSLSVSVNETIAENDVVTYQWSINTLKDNNSYANVATGSTYKIDELELTDAGYYKCIITYMPAKFQHGRSFTATQIENSSVDFINLIVYAAIKINNELTTTGSVIEGVSDRGELRLRLGDTLHLHTELLQGWEPRFEWQKSTNDGETWTSLASLPLVDCKANTDYEEVQTSRINDNALYRAHVANFYPGTDTIGTEDYSSPVVFLRVLRAAKTGNEITSNIVLCKIPFGDLLKNNIRIDKKFMVFTSAQNKDLYNNPVDAENSTPTLHKRNPESIWTKDSKGNLNQNYTQFSFPTDLDIDKESGQYGIAADEKERKVYILDLQNLNYDKANHINTPLLEINIPNYIGKQVGNNYVFEHLGFTVYMHGDYIAVSDPYAWKSNDGANTIKYTGRVFIFKYFKGSNSVRLLNIMQSPNETENGSYGDDIEFDNYGNILISASEELQEVQIGYNINIDGSISPAINADNKLAFHTKGKVYVYSMDDIEHATDVLKLIAPKQILSSQYIPGSIDYNKGDWGVLKTKYYSQSKYFIKDAFGGKRINESFADYASYVEYYNFNYKYDFTYKAQFPTIYTEANFRQGNSAGSKIEYGIQYSYYTNNTDELFGSCMSINNDCLLIGAPFYNQNQGYVELWKFVKTSDDSKDGKYVYNTNVQNINPNKLTCFGQNVEMGENFFLVGYKSGVQIQGVNLFDYSTSKVINNNIEIAPAITRAASFGNSLDSYGNTFLVGSPDEGKIYRYSYTPTSDTASNLTQLQLIDLEKQASVIEFGSKLVMVNDKILASYKSYGSEETVYGEKIVSIGEGAVLQYTLIGGNFRLL